MGTTVLVECPKHHIKFCFACPECIKEIADKPLQPGQMFFGDEPTKDEDE